MMLLGVFALREPSDRRRLTCSVLHDKAWKLRGDLITLFRYLKGGHREEGAPLFLAGTLPITSTGTPPDPSSAAPSMTLQEDL